METPGFFTLRSATRSSSPSLKRFFYIIFLHIFGLSLKRFFCILSFLSMFNTLKHWWLNIFSWEASSEHSQGIYTDFAQLGLPTGAKVASAKVRISNGEIWSAFQKCQKSLHIWQIWSFSEVGHHYKVRQPKACLDVLWRSEMLTHCCSLVSL